MRARLTWIGHSTVVVDMEGVRLVTDPLLRSRVTHLRRVAPVDQNALRGIDAVLVSHVHYDHLDLPSLQRLGRTTPLVVPRGAGRLLRRQRFESVVELGAGEEVAIGPLTVRATEAVHDADRGPLGTSAPSLGYVVGGPQHVYFAGDTDFFEGMGAIDERLDVALLPVWGWGPSLGPGHLDPYTAARALTLLRPRIAVPIHWGTYYPMHKATAAADFLRDPPLAFAGHAARIAPDVEVRVLRLGETFELDLDAARREGL